MTLIVTLCAFENGSSTTRVAVSWYRPPFIMMLMLLTCEELAAAGAAFVAAGAPPEDAGAGAVLEHAASSDAPPATAAAPRVRAKNSRLVKSPMPWAIVGGHRGRVKEIGHAASSPHYILEHLIAEALELSPIRIA